MLSFVQNMYRMGRIGEAEVMAFVQKGHITREEADAILTE